MSGIYFQMMSTSVILQVLNSSALGSHIWRCYDTDAACMFISFSAQSRGKI